jgi:hypothetical protein
MADPHLNLFYPYGARDREGGLLEDNLTRALVHTIKLLSEEHRAAFLDALFSRARHLMYLDRTPDGDELASIPATDFRRADVALQDRIPNKHNPKHANYGDDSRRRVVTISSGHSPKKLSGEKPKDSRPDAWIFDREGASFCLLLECKYGDNPVEEHQIRRHGAEWFGKKAWKMEKEGSWDRDIAPDLLDLTWYDVLEATKAATKEIDRESEDAAAPVGRNELEKQILLELHHFIGFYGYWRFVGFRFSELRRRPEWRLCRLGSLNVAEGKKP